jgi:hypothetical protein
MNKGSKHIIIVMGEMSGGAEISTEDNRKRILMMRDCSR